MQQFEVSRMLMVETARYDDMYLRPYVTRFDQDISNQLIESTQSGTNVNPITLSSAASAFLQPSSVPVARANIAQGFGEKRFSFMLELKDTTSGGLSGGNRYIMTGYTDHLGVSALSGQTNLDPNMRIYFNNMFVLRDTMVAGVGGRHVTTNLAQSRHILHNTGSGDYNNQVDRQWTMRPEDVMARLDYDSNPIMAGFHGADVHDSRSMLSGVVTSDRRKEGRPAYLNETIQSLRSAEAGADNYGGSNDNNSLWQNARDLLREQPLAANKFLSTLSGSTNFRTMGCVTYTELCAVLPDLDYRAEVIMSGGPQQAKEYQPGQGEVWTGSTLETLAATIMQQLVPGIMTDSLLISVGFQATNDTIGGVDDVRVYNVEGFTEGLDYSKHLTHFVERLKREILWDISKGGTISYQVDVRMNLLFDSSFNISINGQPFVYYSSPAFCDGLYAPILSNSLESLEHMASDVGDMYHNIAGDYNRMIVGNERENGYANTPMMDPFSDSIETSL